ncbi:MAG: aminodeoxychorismate synthase component I [Psychrobacillus sp.]
MSKSSTDLTEPLLYFQFSDAEEKIKPLYFTNPKEIIIAYEIMDVIPSIMKIQQYVDSGFFAAGYMSYEAAPAFDNSFKVNHKSKMPLIWFGIYDKPIEGELVEKGEYKISAWEPTIKMQDYAEAFSEIKKNIEDGVTYQVNYTIRLQAQFEGDSLAYYQDLSKAQSSNYCAYINTKEYSILSASPELFFRINGNKIITRPMKGTVKRGSTDEEDLINIRWLASSEKNRSENLMIVDLLRNDLGRLANTGTVKVPKIFEIEEYPTVYQMTSTVTAELPSEIKFADIFKALFPCGSITGAPKISTMEIISKLEYAPREAYCGTIGFITPQKEAIFNVPIRTVIVENATGRAEYGVGGGITWDSTAEEEYNEILTKARFLEVK